MIPVSVNTTSDTVSETVLKIGALYPTFKKYIEKQYGLNDDAYLSMNYLGHGNIYISQNNSG